MILHRCQSECIHHDTDRVRRRIDEGDGTSDPVPTHVDTSAAVHESGILHSKEEDMGNGNSSITAIESQTLEHVLLIVESDADSATGERLIK